VLMSRPLENPKPLPQLASASSAAGRSLIVVDGGSNDGTASDPPAMAPLVTAERAEPAR